MKITRIFIINIFMAKATTKGGGSSNKVTFGKRKQGQPGGKKSYNKHSPRPKASRGQG